MRKNNKVFYVFWIFFISSISPNQRRQQKKMVKSKGVEKLHNISVLSESGNNYTRNLKF